MIIWDTDALLDCAKRVAELKTREVHSGHILLVDQLATLRDRTWPADVYLSVDRTRGIFEMRYWAVK